MAVLILDECYPQMSCYSGHHSLEVHPVITSWLRPGQIHPTSWPLYWPGARSAPPTWSLLSPRPRPEKQGRIGRCCRLFARGGLYQDGSFALDVLHAWARRVILDSSFSEGISCVRSKKRIAAQLPGRFFCFLVLLVDVVSGFTIPLGFAAFGPPFLLRGERFEDGGKRGSTLLAFIRRGASRFCSAVPSLGAYQIQVVCLRV